MTGGTVSSGRKLAVLYVVTSLCLVVLAGGGYTGSAFHDGRDTGAVVSAANDFTVEVGNVAVEPTEITESEGELETTFEIDRYHDLDRDAFTLRLDSGSPNISPVDVSCRPEYVTDGATCTVRFETQAVVGLTDEDGWYTLVLRGQWENGVDFVATGDVRIDGVERDSSGTAAGNTALQGAGNTADTDGTTSAAGNTDGDGDAGTAGNTGGAGNTDGSISHSLVVPGSFPPAPVASRG